LRSDGNAESTHSNIDGITNDLQSDQSSDLEHEAVGADGADSEGCGRSRVEQTGSERSEGADRERSSAGQDHPTCEKYLAHSVCQALVL